MSKVDITPYLPEIEAAIDELKAPPFKFWEPFKLVGSIGDLLWKADALQTPEDYEDAWDQLTVHVEQKYDLFRWLDDKIKAGVFEMFDGPAIRKAWDITGVGLSRAAAEHIG